MAEGAAEPACNEKRLRVDEKTADNVFEGVATDAARSSQRSASAGRAPPLSALFAPFGLALLKRLSKTERGNIWISPWSIATSMAMVTAGATEDSATHNELRSVLGHDALGAEAAVLDAFAASMRLAAADPDVRVISSASAWARNDIHTSFLDKVAAIFGAEAGPLTTPEPINEWCNRKTEGLIPSIIEKVDPLTVLILVSAIYFKGSWSKPFSPDATKSATFAGPDGRRECKMMHDKSRMDYGRVGDAHAVRLHYGQKKAYAAVVLLPDKEGDVHLQQLVEDLSPAAWQRLNARFEVNMVSLSLPRFKLDYGVKSLVEELQDLGIKKVFGDEPGKFNRLSGDPALYLSDVLHKAVCEVNEEGTVAAAATAAVIATRSLPPPAIEVRCDRPFIFAIVHVASGAPLFMGRVSTVE